MAAALAVVLVAVTAVVGADSARRSGRGGVPGFASDLEVPRHELWHEDNVVAAAVTEDLVLVQVPGGDGIRAVRVADGTTAWSVESGYCSVVELDGSRWLLGSGAARTVDPANLRVGCVQYGPQDQGAVLLDMTGSTVARIDATDIQQVGPRLVEVRPDEGSVSGRHGSRLVGRGRRVAVGPALRRRGRHHRVLELRHLAHPARGGRVRLHRPCHR